IVTIDTPHAGSPWARTSLPGFCFTDSSVNRVELVPDSGFLHILNSQRLPSDVVVASVSSWGFGSAGFGREAGDGLVSYSSQNLAGMGVFPRDQVFEVENLFRL